LPARDAIWKNDVPTCIASLAGCAESVHLAVNVHLLRYVLDASRVHCIE
jgi:hypothetical protein